MFIKWWQQKKRGKTHQPVSNRKPVYLHDSIYLLSKRGERKKGREEGKKEKGGSYYLISLKRGERLHSEASKSLGRRRAIDVVVNQGREKKKGREGRLNNPPLFLHSARKKG